MTANFLPCLLLLLGDPWTLPNKILITNFITIGLSCGSIILVVDEEEDDDDKEEEEEVCEFKVIGV